MTIARIRELADELGYTLVGSKKAELIASFLSEQEAAMTEE